MTIKQLVTRPPVNINESDDLALALQVMSWAEIRHLPVVKGEALVGVITERDVLRCFAELGRAAGGRRRVGAAMTTPPIIVGPDDGVEAAIKLVIERGIGCLPVVERGRVVGVVTRRDLLGREIRPEAPTPLPELIGSKEPGAAWTRMLVDDVMSTDPVTASADDSLRTVVDRMGRQGIRHVPIIDGERRVVGILSDRDVRTAIGNPMRGLDPREAIVRIESTRVHHAMSRSPSTLPAGTRLSRAAALFVDQKVGAVPIVDERERLVGLVSYTDVLRAILGPKPDVS